MAEETPDSAVAPTTAEAEAPDPVEAPATAEAGAPAQRQGGLCTDVLWSALTAVGLTAEGGTEPTSKTGPGAALISAPAPASTKSKKPKKTEAKEEAKAKAAEPAPPEAGSGGHTPESIARLPPKLRARLLQRGILKEQDVRAAEARTAEAAKASAATALAAEALAKAPAAKASAAEALAAEAPAAKAPAAKVSAAEALAAEAPAAKAPAVEALAAKAPAAKASAAEALAAKAPAAKAPAIEALAVKAPAAKAPATKASPAEACSAESFAKGAPSRQPGAGASPGTPPLATPFLKAPPASPPPLRAAELLHSDFEAAAAGPDFGGDQEPAFAMCKAGSLAALAAEMQEPAFAAISKCSSPATLAAEMQEPAFAAISKAGSLATLAAAQSKASAQPAAPPPRVVYSAAPVLSSDAMRKRAAAEADEDDESEAKRPREEATPPEPSPATLRAAAAQAQGGSVPTWTFRDGVLSQDGVPVVRAQEAAAKAAVPAPAAAVTSPAAATVEVPPGEPPLPPGWVRVPHEGDFYYWNTTTDQVSWEHPAEAQGAAKKELFHEEHKVLWTDVGKIIGRQGMSLKIMKASLGCTVKIPRQGGKGSAKGKGDKGKGDKGKGDKGKGGKGKGKDEGNVGRGIGTGETPLTDDQFATVVISGETKHMAMAGKRTIEIMLGYGRNVERALGALGIEVKMPATEDMPGGKEGSNSKDGIDPMDPAAYSEAPVGSWSAGLPKPDGRGRRCGPEPRDAKTANAERF